MLIVNADKDIFNSDYRNKQKIEPLDGVGLGGSFFAFKRVFSGSDFSSTNYDLTLFNCQKMDNDKLDALSKVCVDDNEKYQMEADVSRLFRTKMIASQDISTKEGNTIPATTYIKAAHDKRELTAETNLHTPYMLLDPLCSVQRVSMTFDVVALEAAERGTAIPKLQSVTAYFETSDRTYRGEFAYHEDGTPKWYQEDGFAMGFDKETGLYTSTNLEIAIKPEQQQAWSERLSGLKDESKILFERGKGIYTAMQSQVHLTLN